jgi:His-Xaa-Ser system protein HxsD
VLYKNGIVEVTIDLRIYRLAAVKKSAYRFANKCAAVLGRPDNELLPVQFHFDGVKEGPALATVRAFFNDLLDQELREHIAEETGPLRSLILAHAFSRLDLIRRD